MAGCNAALSPAPQPPMSIPSARQEPGASSSHGVGYATQCRFRFRVAEWGQVNWRRVITSLVTAGYDYVLSYEHEATMTSPEDGVEQCIERLRPQVVKKPLEAVWW